MLVFQRGLIFTHCLTLVCRWGIYWFMVKMAFVLWLFLWPFFLGEPPVKDVTNWIFPVWANWKCLWLGPWVKLDKLCCNWHLHSALHLFHPNKPWCSSGGWNILVPGFDRWNSSAEPEEIFFWGIKQYVWETLEGHLCSLALCWNPWDLWRNNLNFIFRDVLQVVSQECPTDTD